jgi:hypothetical protein
MEYASKLRLLGLPLIHVAIGGQPRGIAKGWIAFGDVAFGVLFSLGGMAVGGIAIGGASFGVLAFGGGAFGVWALGGLAVAAYQAVGAVAFSAYAAFGEQAVAGEFAMGGQATAAHANDSAASAHFKGNWAVQMMNYIAASPWIIWLFCAVVIIPVLILNRIGKRPQLSEPFRTEKPHVRSITHGEKRGSG